MRRNNCSMSHILIFIGVIFLSKATLANLPNRHCLDAIKNATGGEVGQCYKEDFNSFDLCGPLKLAEPYWIDCGRPGTAFKSCASYLGCSLRCLRALFRKYIPWCVGWDRAPTCRDYVMVLRGGAFGCQKSPEFFWEQVSLICQRRGYGALCDG